MLNEEMSAGTNAEQSKNDETQLPSSPTIGNANVIGSQCPPMTLDDAIVALGVKENYIDLKTFFDFIMSCLKNVEGFYEWFTKTHTIRNTTIVYKLNPGFCIDLGQIRELYSSMSSSVKLTLSPSGSNTTTT